LSKKFTAVIQTLRADIFSFFSPHLAVHQKDKPLKANIFLLNAPVTCASTRKLKARKLVANLSSSCGLIDCGYSDNVDYLIQKSKRKTIFGQETYS